MTYRKLGIVFGIVMSTLCVSRVEAADKIQYKLKLDEGQKYFIRTTMVQQMSQTIMGQAQQGEQEMGMGFGLSIRINGLNFPKRIL